MARFQGKIERDVRDSTPDWTPYLEPAAREGAPNVLFIVWDDMGYGSWDLYGGLVRMPNMARIAGRGLTFSQFHTTALCSPTRASLLTGRNAQSNGMGTIGELSDGFPGLSCLIPPENAFLPEILRENGYNTFAVGKWHLSPASEMSMGASKRTWPLSRGFDRFYGFLGGLTDQWYPDLTYDNHPVDPPASPADGYHLSKDLADRAIEFLRDSMSTAPAKPWFTYLAPGATHAPHHVFPEWADQYAGTFSMGYEKYREVVLANQIRLGLVPEATTLPPLNPYADATSASGQPWTEADGVRPWNSLSDDERRLFERQAEVYAGYATYTDDQIGRVLDFLEETGQLDDTLIVVLSDNGASAEGGPYGSVNENRWYNGIPEDLDQNLALLPELGAESTHPHYSAGWAMAFDTPFKQYKTYANFEGGTADPLLLSWPARVSARGELRSQYLHVSDIVPTVLDCLGIATPAEVAGRPLADFDGVSVRAVIDDGEAPTPKREQFYSMLGTRGIWVDGWHASTVHPPMPTGWGRFDDDTWELFHLADDRNQLVDLADAEPERLEALKRRWDELAECYNGFPLDDRTALEIMTVHRPDVSGDRTTSTLYPDSAPVPEHSGVQIIGKPFVIQADLIVDDPAVVEGVVYSLGARFGGHALFVQDRRIRYVYNYLGEREQTLNGAALSAGQHRIRVEYTIEGREGSSPTGTARLLVDDAVQDSATIVTQPAFFSLSGEGATVGREVGQPVSTSYRPPFAFRGGSIAAVTISVPDPQPAEHELRTRAAHGRD